MGKKYFNMFLNRHILLVAFEEGIKYTVYCIAKMGGFQYFYWICSLWLLLQATLGLCMVWIKCEDSIYHPWQNDDQVSVRQISFSLSFSTSALALLAASVAKKEGGLSSWTEICWHACFHRIWISRSSPRRLWSFCWRTEKHCRLKLTLLCSSW